MRVGVELMMTNISVAKSSLLPSKMMQGTWMVRASSGRCLRVEVERREAMLPVDDEVLAARLLEVADAVHRADRLEREPVGREEEHRARNGRLADRGLVEVLDPGDLRLRQLALEGGVGLLDLRDEARRPRRRAWTSSAAILSPSA